MGVTSDLTSHPGGMIILAPPNMAVTSITISPSKSACVKFTSQPPKTAVISPPLKFFE